MGNKTKFILPKIVIPVPGEVYRYRYKSTKRQDYYNFYLILDVGSDGCIVLDNNGKKQYVDIGWLGDTFTKVDC